MVITILRYPLFSVLFFIFIGSFRQGIEPGTILKKLSMSERVALEKLNEDAFLGGFVPNFSGIETINGEGESLLDIYVSISLRIYFFI